MCRAASDPWLLGRQPVNARTGGPPSSTLLAEAQSELGTEGISETVREALRQAAASRARMRQVEWLTAGGSAGLADPVERGRVWR